METLKYIKANGVYHVPQKEGVKDETKRFGDYPVCTITKLWFGRWKVEYFDEFTANLEQNKPYDENIANQKIILYPSGIEEIRYDI